MSATPPLHFRRVQVRRLAGIDSEFTVDDLSPGINVVYGPNGCGKSRTAAAVNMLLWPGSSGRASLAGLASFEGEEWRIDLDAGAVSYQRGGADCGPPHLPPPDARDRYNLPLHELLRDDGAGDFAATILRESAGGYDVKAAAEGLGARSAPSIPKKEAEALKSASRALKDAEDAQRRLLEEEQKLADLERSLSDARHAAGRAELLRAAEKYRAARESLAAAEAPLSQFPGGIERLRGDELETLGRLDEEMRDARAAVERSRAEVGRCDRELADCNLGDAGLADEVPTTLAARHQRLAELRNTLDTSARQRDGALAERAKARALVSPAVSDEQLAQVGAETMRELAAFAREALTAGADKAARDAMQAWLGQSPVPTSSDPEQTTYALRLLWRWLQTPPAPPPAPRANPTLLFVAGVVIVAEALALAATVHWGFVGFGLLPVLLLLLARRPEVAAAAADPRVLIADEFARTGVAVPADWTPDNVGAAAERLAQYLATTKVDAEKAHRWADLASRRAALDDTARRLDVRRQFVCAHFGVPPDTDPLSLVALASAVGVWQEADARLARAQAEYDSTLERFNDELSAAAELLRPYGYEVTDVASLAGAAEALRDRQARFVKASHERQSASQRVVDARRQADVTGQQVDALYARLGLEAGDEATLRRWCAQRPQWDTARQRAARAGVEAKVAQDALAADPSLRDASPAEVEAALRDAEDAAARAEELREKIVAIRMKVDAAKKAADVEEALAAQEAALRALSARRDDDCGAVATWVLAEFLRRENRDRHRPAVFHRARELFSRVTQGRYRLEFDDSDPPAFRAVDTSSGVGHTLDELSSGTRLQLLLSVRVAFVEEQERGVKLPILLDEALANSDETRARAIIDATIAIARSGRQVFYFTAQQDEVAKWKAILERAGDVPHRLIDLAEVRGLAATERLPLREITPLAQPKVPEPVGLSREQYAALLQVPAFDPSRPEVGGTHLWHLIEDPRVLYKFLDLGINTWGQLKTLGEFNAATLVNGSRDALRAASAAARTLEAMADAWRVGRGRRADRQAVLDSGAVTEKFVDPVCALLEEVGRDALRLVEALDDGRVKHFRKDAVANLRGWFCEHGYIDERPAMSAEQIRARMLAAAADEIRRGGFDARRVDAYLSACGISADCPAR